MLLFNKFKFTKLNNLFSFNIKCSNILNNIMNDSSISESHLNSPKSQSNPLTNKLADKSRIPTNRFFKRRYITRIFWLLTILTIIFSFIFLKPFTALIVSFSMTGVAGLLNVLFTYISTKKLDFSPDAYITIIISYCIALTILLIVPLDISASLSVKIDTNTNSTNSTNTTEEINNKPIHDGIDITWKVVYWASIIVNFILLQFQIAYWCQGHPTIRQKVMKTLKQFIRQLIILTIIGAAVLIFLMIKYLSLMHGIEIIQSVIQVLNSLYCVAYILLLFGYGLVQLPFHFLTYTNSSVNIKVSLKALSKTREELEDGVNKLLKDKAVLISYCAKVIDKQKQIPESKKSILVFAKHILKEIEDYKFEINKLINTKKVDGNIKDPLISNVLVDLTEDALGNMLVTVKDDYYFCSKKEASMLRLYSGIAQNCEIVDDSGLNFTKNTFKNNNNNNINEKGKKKSIVMNRAASYNNNFKIAFLLPKNYPMVIKIITKIFGLVLISISLMFLIFQINLMFITKFNIIYTISTFILKSNFYLNYLFIIFYFSYFFICCFYSLSKFKFFEIYILVPHHTNKLGMAYNSSMCNTLILGICYNILYFYSFIYDKANNNASTSASALNDFFNSMKKVEFVYVYYIYFFPIILILIVLITLMRKFKLFCFKGDKYNELEVELDFDDKTSYEIISEDTFKDQDGHEGKIRFEILENIQDIYKNGVTQSNEFNLNAL